MHLYDRVRLLKSIKESGERFIVRQDDDSLWGVSCTNSLKII